MTSRFLDGEPRPEPAKWREGLCPKCQPKDEPASSDGADQFNGRPVKSKRRKTGGRKKKPGPPPPTVEQREQALALMKEGKSNDAIAKDLGIDYGATAGIRREAGLPTPQVIRGRLNAAKARAYLAAHPAAGRDQIMAATGLPKMAVEAARAEARQARAAT